MTEMLSKASKTTGPTLSRRNLLIGGILLSASGIAFARQPEIAAPKIETKLFRSLVPARFGPWEASEVSDVILPPPDALRDRIYDNLVTRTYSAPGRDPVMMLIAYNNQQDGMLQVHRPEVCYPVGGFRLSETRPVTFASTSGPIPANFFTAVGPDRTEQVAYFTRLGTAYPRSWAQQRLAVMRANLEGDIPDGMMLRVSLLGDNPATALRELSDFASAFIAASPPRLRKLLVVQA